MASSLQEYLKRYSSDAEKPKKKKKKLIALKGKGALTIVDADPVWQKDIKEVSSESEAEQGDAPLVIEDVEFKRMQRLEALRMRPYMTTAADGSGWVSVNESLNQGRHDSPELSPPRTGKSLDLSPPRRRQISSREGRHDSPQSSPSRTVNNLDLSPPRRRQISSREGRHDSPQSSPSRTVNNLDLSPPRRRQTSTRTELTGHHGSSESSPPKAGKSPVLSPPRRSQTFLRMVEHDEGDTDLSPKRRRFNHDDSDAIGVQKHKRKEIMADGTAAGLQSGRQQVKGTEKKKQDDYRRLKEVDTSISGRHAITVYRDKHGKRLEGVDEILKLQQAKEPKKEEKPLEWGRGLVQKREAKERYAELEAEKKKPFARARDDPDLEKALKERVRWGDPMAHLVKQKIGEPILVDLSTSELMKESGFIVPQDIPKHSWLKRGVTPPPNRYGIKPGRHWDGVDRSTGYERDMYKRQNEKAAEQVEAYLWSVADM